MPTRVLNKYFNSVDREKFFSSSDGPILSDKNMSMNDRNWSLRLGVYDRLFTHHTFNSIRRDNRFVINDMAPNDSLDFALSSIYVHGEDYNVPKCYIPMQPETLNIPIWKVHQNQHHTASSGYSKINKDKGTKGKATGSIKKKVNGPKISIATTSTLPVKKKNKKKQEKSFSVMRKYKKVSEHRATSKMTPRQQHKKLPIKKTHEKSSSSQKIALLSDRKLDKKHRKVQPTMRGHGQTSFEKKYAVTKRDIQFSEKMMTEKRQEIAVGETEDDTPDKTQRRESYAAQMRPIERIHPSSLKLAVDGPHSDQTNPGYSRKIDGTFYGI